MGKHSDKDAPSSSSKKPKSHHHHHGSSSSSKSKSKSKSSSSSNHHHHHNHDHEPSRLEVYVTEDRPDERFAQGMPSDRGNRAADMAQWDARWESASSKR
ncbi:hypothetical protein PG994_003921 [Apiospora phragmitis]|uniref:Uncharacterized protein n=1 Tax=Apiospora phragmitis TaxID=2905665 RepID=A0ABR1VZH3_9PEZI